MNRHAVPRPGGPRPAGPRPRRRGRLLEDDIRATVVDLLVEHGFAALTMDLVAARARAGKATLYRRWSGKLDLVVDAVAQLGASPASDPDTGTLRGDVLAQLRELARSLAGRHGAASASVIGELKRHPELGAAVRGPLVDRRREVAERISRRAVRRGEARADAPWGTVNEIGPALLFSRVLLAGETVDEEYLNAVVDGVVLPLVAHSAAAPTRIDSPHRGPTRPQPNDGPHHRPHDGPHDRPRQEPTAVPAFELS